MPQSSIAVIIPVYNRATLWRRAVDSVMRQGLLPKHLVIADDGSTDATGANIRKWLGNDSHSIINGVAITLLNQKHSNASTARNLGLAHIKSAQEIYDYILFLDSDDEIPSNFIENTTKVLEEQAQVVAVSSPRLTLQQGKINNHCVFDDMQDLAKSPVNWMLYYGGSILSCTLFRSTALPEDGFNQLMVMGEDMLFATQVAMQGEWSVVPGAPTKFWRQDFAVKSNTHGTYDRGIQNMRRAEEPSLSLVNDPKQTPDSAMAAIQARVKTFHLVRKSKKLLVRSSYLHGIVREFYGLAFTSSCGLAKYGYALAFLYHSAMRWLTWLIRK